MHRTVLFVAPQFPPCNLTAGHRTRLVVRYLPEFGYRPIVLTMRREDYEERIDPELEQMVPLELEVIRTRALPIRPVRLVGDYGLRTLPFHLAAIRRLVRQRQVDLLYITMAPFYSSLLGPLSRRLFGLPYALDYQDPWVYPITTEERRSWKARVSHFLARVLEPLAVSTASGITGVAESYYAGVLSRNPHLRQCPSSGIPIGGERLDHEHVARARSRPRLLDHTRLTDKVVLVYAGALLPRAHGTLRTLLHACKRWRESGDPLAQRLMLFFVGTGARPTDPTSGLVMPIAQECGAQDFVLEIAARQPYLDVLSLLHHADGVLILGSSESAYTASKTFQALHSCRPILALLHAASSASTILRQMPAVTLINFTDNWPVESCLAEIEAGVRAIAMVEPKTVPRDLTLLEPFSAREMSRQLAYFFDAVLAQNARMARKQ